MRDAKPIGTEAKSPQGYTIVKTEDGWKLKHRLMAEEKIGRKLDPHERVVFVDNDRENLDPDNIEVRLTHKERDMSNMPTEQRVKEIVQELEDYLAAVQLKLEELEL